MVGCFKAPSKRGSGPMNRSLPYRYAMPQNRCERFLRLEIFLDGSPDGLDSHHATRCRAANRKAAETCQVIGAEHAASGHKKAPSLFRSPVTLDVEKLMAASGVQIKDAERNPPTAYGTSFRTFRSRTEAPPKASTMATTKANRVGFLLQNLSRRRISTCGRKPSWKRPSRKPYRAHIRLAWNTRVGESGPRCP